jgi:uncharacterized HhH-GPD family protein
LHLAQDPDADALLSSDPLALLLGMLLDQQFPMERAFAGPALLRDRLGHDLDARELAQRTDLVEIFTGPPAIHRYPGSMAGRVQTLCQQLVERYDGRAEGIWEGVDSGTEVLRRLKALPGFGDQKAKIFLALLGKQCGLQAPGWREAAGHYGEEGSFASVADIVSPESLAKVRAHKQAVKAAAKAAKG